MSTANSRLRPRPAATSPRKSAAKIMARHVEAQMRGEVSRLERELLSLKSLGYTSDEAMIVSPNDLSGPPYVTLGVFLTDGDGRNKLRGR